MTEKELKNEVLEDDFGSWDWVEQVEKHVPAISAAELMEMTIEPKEFVVREILTPGLSMLGGAPKCGKSWFVLDLCVHVATGEPFLGFPVTKGSAWYISLEDTKEDLYWRLDAITDKELPNLFLSTEDDPIGNLEDGLEKHLNNYIEQHKDMKLIVIDTFQLARGTNRESNYPNDYADTQKLKKIADKHKVAILLVHHLRKMHDPDPVNMLSGSTGLSGGVAGNFVMYHAPQVYLGKIRWRREPVKKVVKDGFLAKTRILNNDYELYDGLHEPIITEEQWERVKTAQKERGHSPVNVERQLRNPFAGILFCDKCGGIMKRNIPDKKRNPTPWYRCSTRGCDCKIIKCDTVEIAIRNAMEQWLKEYKIQIGTDKQPTADPILTALESVRGQLAQLQLQQDTICEYLEKGVYTIDMFTKRNTTLSKEIRQLQIAEADLLRQQGEGEQKKQASTQIIPTTQHILDSYPSLSPAEKNQLWKLVMTKATVYRSQDDQLTIHIYPNLPK